MQPDEKAIRSLIDTWFRATTSGDLSTVLALMADDVVFLGPGRPPMLKEGFAEASRAMEGQMRIEASFEIQELRVFGDWAYCWNQIRVAMTSAAADTVVRSGPALSIFARQSDGRWVLVRDANMVAPENPTPR